MDLFHNEIISFCLRKATIKLASALPIQMHRPFVPIFITYHEPFLVVAF
jgi:hypothetical protein